MSAKKYFIVSDIHSFYTIFHNALIEAGFDIENKNHILLILGDVFDRGLETIKLYEFLKNMPDDRLILTKGNHEELFMDLLHKDFPDENDFPNGTVSTFCQIANIEGVDEKYIQSGIQYSYGTYYDSVRITDDTKAAWKAVLEKVGQSEIVEWLLSDKWKNYYEIGNYICTHGFIPVKVKEKCCVTGLWALRNATDFFEYDPNWREASQYEWDDSIWRKGWKFYKAGMFRPEMVKDKILVVGHQPSYYCRIYLDGVKYQSKDEIDYGIYYSKCFIDIDACTNASGKCNVLVIEEE